jgi:DNA-binding transcriptional MerR regulator
MSIGALSDLTSVKVPTIRYYEGIGLLAPAARTEANRRTYSRDDVRRLRFIRHARDLGFEIEAIRQLLGLASDPSRSCDEADAIARRHLVDIDEKIARLTALKFEVTRMIENCAHGSIGQCRVIEVLADHGQCESERH